MSLMDHALNLLTTLLGGFLLFLIAFISIFSSVNALLAISDENRIIFSRSKRIYGIIILFFGLMLYFRGISFFATLLSISWTSIFFEFCPKIIFFQAVFTLLGSFIFWIRFFYSNDTNFLQIIGDSLIFITIPFVIAIVDFSCGSEILSGKGKTNYDGPYINLRSFLSKCYSYIDKIFPADWKKKQI